MPDFHQQSQWHLRAQACQQIWSSTRHQLLQGTSQPGWEDLGWENASYCLWYQVTLFDSMVRLNNECSHCKLQLEEVALPRGYREECVQPRSSSTGNVTTKSKTLAKWCEVGDLEADGQKTRQP